VRLAKYLNPFGHPDSSILAIGLDDVSELFVASAGYGDEVIVLRTAHDMSLREFTNPSADVSTETLEGVECATVRSGIHRFHVAKTGPGVLCLSQNRQVLGAALRRVSGRDRSVVADPLRRALHKVRHYDHCYSGVFDERALTGLFRLSEGLKAVALGVTVDTTIRGEVVFEFAAARQAADGVQALQGELAKKIEALEEFIAAVGESHPGRARWAATRAMLSKAQISWHDSLVSAVWSFDEDETDLLLQNPPYDIMGAVQFLFE